MERDAHDLVGGLTFRTEQDRIAQLERQCARSLLIERIHMRGEDHFIRFERAAITAT